MAKSGEMQLFTTWSRRKSLFKKNKGSKDSVYNGKSPGLDGAAFTRPTRAKANQFLIGQFAFLALVLPPDVLLL